MNFTRVAQTQAKKSTSGGGGAFLGALALAGAGLIGSFIFQGTFHVDFFVSK